MRAEVVEEDTYTDIYTFSKVIATNSKKYLLYIFKVKLVLSNNIIILI